MFRFNTAYVLCVKWDQARCQYLLRWGHELVQLGDIYTQIYISIYIHILQEGAISSYLH